MYRDGVLVVYLSVCFFLRRPVFAQVRFLDLTVLLVDYYYYAPPLIGGGIKR